MELKNESDMEALYLKWEKAYDEFTAIDDDGIDDLDFFSVAAGFCMANGVNYADCVKFYYGYCVKRGKY